MIEYLEKVIELRQRGKSYSDVGKKLGISRAWVGMLLQEHRPDLAGRQISENNPELDGIITEPDDLVGLKLDVKFSKILGKRLSEAKLRHEGVNLSRRRRNLVKKLWGDNKVPGPNFAEWLEENIISKFDTEHQRKVFTSFYLVPIDEALSVRASNDPDKTFRSYILTDLLPSIIKPFNVKSLLEQGVLKYGRKQRSSNPESN